jgi:DNA-binding transcriptional LysR family regulator
MNVALVETFLAVVAARSFRRAGARLGLSQPTVSQHVWRLEAHLGVRLVERRASGALPTPDAERFLPYAESLVTLSRKAVDALAGRRLAVGASTNVGVYLLPPFLRAWRDLTPPVAPLDIVLDRNPVVAERLARREIDVAVMEWQSETPGYKAEIWRRERLTVIVSPSHPWAGRGVMPLRALRGTPMIGGEAGTGTGRLLRAVLGPRLGDIPIGLTLPSTEAVKQAVKAGLGVSIVLASAVVDEVRAGSLCALDLEDVALAKDVWVARRDDLPPGAPARRFTELLLTRC